MLRYKLKLSPGASARYYRATAKLKENDPHAKPFLEALQTIVTSRATIAERRAQLSRKYHSSDPAATAKLVRAELIADLRARRDANRALRVSLNESAKTFPAATAAAETATGQVDEPPMEREVLARFAALRGDERSRALRHALIGQDKSLAAAIVRNPGFANVTDATVDQLKITLAGTRQPVHEPRLSIPNRNTEMSDVEARKALSEIAFEALRDYDAEIDHETKDQ